MSRTLKKQAKKLAKKGRFGDKHLLHVTDKELGDLKATGKLTTNPETGLPEASVFTSIRDNFEAGLGGAAIGGPVGSVGAQFFQAEHPDSPTSNFLEDLGGGIVGAGALALGGEAAGIPMWGGGGGAEAGAEGAAYYGDLPVVEGAGGAGAAGAAGDQLYADEWAAAASRAAPAVAGGTGMSVPQMFMLGMGATSAATAGYGLYNAYEGRQAQKKQQRQQQEYYDRLNDLMAHPERVRDLPGYQFNVDEGQKALQRRMASMGMGKSGNLALATEKYGQDYATAALTQQEQLLASQYGRASPPTGTMPDPTSLAMSSLSNMGYGFAPFMYSMNPQNPGGGGPYG